MNKNVQDSPDELLRKLHERWADQSSDDDTTPADVFTPQQAKTDASDDEDIAAFDSYMAELLGELVPAKQPTENANTEIADEIGFADDSTEENTVADTFDLNGEEQELPTFYEPDEAEQQAVGADDEVDEGSGLPDAERTSAPDMQIELSNDEDDVVYEHENAVSVDEPIEPVPAFEVIEQLSIAQQADEPETHHKSPEIKPDEDADDIKPNLIDELLEDEPSEDELTEQEQIQGVVEDEAFDHGTPENEPNGVTAEPTDVVFDRAADVAQQDVLQDEPTEQEMPPVVLSEGDILLDEAEEIPDTPEEQTETEPDTANVEQKAIDEPSATPVPVASPLDAARDQHDAQKSEEAPQVRPKQSPLDAMAARAMSNVEAPRGVGAFGNRQNREKVLSDDDVELLLDLGYEVNLIQKVGSQRVESVRYRRQDDEKARRRLRHVYGCAGEEYSSHTQDKQIKGIYRRQTTASVVRLVLEILMALLLLLTDLLPTMADRLPPAVAGVPMSSAFGLFGIALLVLSAFVALPLLERGAKALVRFSPIPASMPVVLLILTLIYDVILLFYGDCGILLNFPTALSFVILAAAEIMTVLRESMTFEVVSAHSRKIVMHPIAPRKKKVVRDGHIVKIINDDAGKRTWRVHPTDQVALYFRRNRQGTPRYRMLSSLLLMTVLVAFVVGLVTLIVTDSPRTALTTFLLTAQIALPVSAAVSYAYPMLFAARTLAKDGCAIIGHGAVDEYAGEKTLVFDDTEMFRSKSSTEITIKGSGDTKKYIRYAKRLFRTLGGTLRSISTSDLSEEAYEERVEILKILENGVEARIDNKVNILLGSSAFMVERGIRVPGESAELLVRRSVESSIVYLAFDGVLRLGYEIDYRISGRFEQMVAELARMGTDVAIETCDPSINDDLLTRSRKSAEVGIEVTKPIQFERHVESLLCDSGVVATRSARDISAATAACDRLLENDAQLSLFHRIAPWFGGVLMLGLSLFGLLSRSMTVIAALMQLVWCIPALMLTRKNLIREQISENENANKR